MPAGGYEDALFELKAPSSLHGLTEKVLLARKIAVWYAHAPPTCLRALPLQRMLTVCMLVRCRSLARMELRQARRHVEHDRASAILRSSSTASSFVAAGAQSPNRVSAALLVCMVLPACESTPDTCLLHSLRCKWVEGAQARKNQGKIKSGRKTGFSGALAAPIH